MLWQSKTKLADCPCYMCWVCKDHPYQPWGTTDVEVQESCVKSPVREGYGLHFSNDSLSGATPSSDHSLKVYVI
jgi:hypothetical protein